jgi:hypothetical protein
MARIRFRRLIHNFVTSVRKANTVVSVQPDPRFEARNQITLLKWDDFHCSIFHFLSGKTDRLLSERGERDLVAQLGLTPETAIVVQYVCDDLLYEPDYEGDEPEVPLTSTINNLTVNDEILWEGEWWKIKAVIPDSEGIQHTVFACK